MQWLDRVLGHPWVYEHVRPLSVGGIDMSHAYRQLDCERDAVLLDVGCGTGDALKHLGEVSSYLGIDTDPVAIRYAQERWQQRRFARFECRHCTAEDLRAFSPSHVSMIGLLHHVDDETATGLLSMLRESPRLKRAVTLDIVELPGLQNWYNNMLARLDRGRFCRTEAGYIALARRAGLSIKKSYHAKSHPTRGLVKYFVLVLEP
jgi:ubiquinone/menaquinone biosynthesis C-methylase UbiE